jgi:transposase-like protein
MQKKLEPKAALETMNLSIASVASQGARRATEDATEAGHLNLPPEGDMEVVAHATRRNFPSAEKPRIVAKADACTQYGEIGVLLRQEGIYSSSLSSWCSKRDAGELEGVALPKRGAKVNPVLAETGRFEQFTRENKRLQNQLDKAMLVNDVQKSFHTAWIESAGQPAGEHLMQGVIEFTPSLGEVAACRALGT